MRAEDLLASVFPVAWRNGDFSSLLNTGGRTIQIYNPFSADAAGRRVDQHPLARANRGGVEQCDKG